MCEGVAKHKQMSKTEFHPTHLKAMQQAVAMHRRRAHEPVAYYRELHDPKSEDSSRTTIPERLARAIDRENEAKRDAQDHLKYWDNGHLVCYIDKYELMDALRDVIQENMLQARDWNDHAGIVRNCYKVAVRALDILRRLEPQYEAVTARFFMYYN